MTIEIKNINKRYEDKIIFKDFNITLEVGKVNCILGKSGCGKSTLLKIISGLLKNDNKLFRPLNKSDISYIFQEDRLLDWLTIEENIRIVGKKKFDKRQLEKRIKKYLEVVDILEYSNQYPQMLSGGIRQRANIARAFIKQSKYIIMDEPFKSIDIKNKYKIMDKIKKIIRDENKTVLFVTHDIEEAMFLADCIFVLGNKPVDVKGTFYNLKPTNKDDIIEII